MPAGQEPEEAVGDEGKKKGRSNTDSGCLVGLFELGDCCSTTVVLAIVAVASAALAALAAGRRR